MGRHSNVPGRNARPVVLALVAALGTIAAALALLFAGSTSAGAATTTAKLTFQGAQTASAPGGTGLITLTTGDSVVFSEGAAPTRERLDVGYHVLLNASPFGGPSSVNLANKKTYTVSFPTAGSYAFFWSASGTLGSVHPQGSEYTTATIVVNDPPAPPTTAPATDPATDTASAPATDPATGTATSTGTPGAPASSGSSGTPGAPGASSTPGAPRSTGRVPIGRPGSFPTNGSDGIVAIAGSGGGGFSGPQDNGNNAVSTQIPNGFVAPANIPNAPGAKTTAAGSTNQQANAGQNAVLSIPAANPPTPPLGLAVAAILALAIVSTLCAYRYFGPAFAVSLPWSRRDSDWD